MKALIFTVVMLIIGTISHGAYSWWAEPCRVQGGICEVWPPDIKRAMVKMGPLYGYRFWEDSKRLEVNTGDGKWRRLRY